MVQLADRVGVSTSTTGTGTIVLGAALPGYLQFNAASTNLALNTHVRYLIEDGANWELGTGLYNIGLTLTRTLQASSTGALLNLSGNAKVYIVPGAEDFYGYWIKLDANYTLTSSTAVQKLFDSPTNGALSLARGHYIYEAFLLVTAMSATSGNAGFDVRGAGTATLVGQMSLIQGVDSSTPLSSTPVNISGEYFNATSTASPAVTAATGTGLAMNVRGMFSVTSAGTIIPSISLQTAAAAVVNTGSWFHCKYIGAADRVSWGSWT